MKRPLSAPLRRFAPFLAIVVSAGLWSCQSMTLSPEAGTLPTVEVRGAFPSEIAAACDEVFGREGYRLASIDGDSRVYEKGGSWLQEAAYGTWLNRGVAERLQVQIRGLGADSHTIECEPLLVSHAGSRLEEVRRFPKWKRSKYKSMLNAVKNRLGFPA